MHLFIHPSILLTYIAFPLFHPPPFPFRKKKNKSRWKEVKSKLEDVRAVDPWEIDELRQANEHTLTPEKVSNVYYTEERDT